MKKALLIASLSLGSFFTVNAQSLLQQEDFNGLVVGNVGTDLTGTVVGQGGFFTGNAAGGTNGANSNYQIVTDILPAHGKVLQITGSDAATGTRNMWKDGLNTAWAARTSGNDIIEFVFSFYTGAATASTSSLRPIVFSATAAIGGFAFNMNTKRLDGFAYGDFNNTGTPGNYLITLKAGGLILPVNTWIKAGFAYNTVTGLFTWKSNDVTPVLAGTIAGAPGYVPDEFDIVYVAGTANAVSSTVKFDDYRVRATSTENILSVDDISSDSFFIYPNPVNDILNITNLEKVNIQTINIVDMNGRTVKQSTSPLNDQINISDLSSGIYMLNIKSDKGSITKKIIKN